MWSSSFAAREGAGIAEILRITGCRTYSEFIDQTDPFERTLIIQSIQAWHDKQEGAATGL